MCNASMGHAWLPESAVQAFPRYRYDEAATRGALVGLPSAGVFTLEWSPCECTFLLPWTFGVGLRTAGTLDIRDME